MAGSQDPSHLRQMEDLEKRYKYLAAEVEEVAELIFCHLEWIQNCSKRWQTVRIGIWLQKMNNLRLTKLRLWCCIRDVLRSPPCRVCAAVEIQREHLCWIFKNHKDSLCYYVGSRWIIVFSQLVCFQSRFSAAYCILLSLNVPCIYMKFVLDLAPWHLRSKCLQSRHGTRAIRCEFQQLQQHHGEFGERKGIAWTSPCSLVQRTRYNDTCAWKI